MSDLSFSSAAAALFGKSDEPTTPPPTTTAEPVDLGSAAERLYGRGLRTSEPPTVRCDGAARLYGGADQGREAWDNEIRARYGADTEVAVAAAARGLRRFPELRESVETLGCSPDTFDMLVRAAGERIARDERGSR